MEDWDIGGDREGIDYWGRSSGRVGGTSGLC